MAEKNFTDFQGNSIDINQVVAVEPVETFLTSSLSCDWEYGFIIRLNGNSVTVKKSPPSTFGYAGGISREDYRKQVEDLRKEFLGLIK